MKRRILCLCLLVCSLALLLALPVAAEETKTIKAGTYRFNDVLTAPSADIAEDINYSVTTLFKAYDVTIQGNCNQIRVYLNYDGEENVLVYTAVSSEPDFSSAGVSYPIPFRVYDEVGWNYTDYDEGIQTITITEDTEVSDEFYEWFNKNAVEQRQISGVWKFKDELTVPSVSDDKGVKFSFILNGEAVIDVLGGEAVIGCSGMELIRQDAQGYPLDVYYICETSSVDLSAFGITLPHSFCVYDSNGWRIADYGEGVKIVDFGAEPQTVSADFYEWFTANAKPLLDDECTNYTDALYACECDVSLGSAWNGPEIYWAEDGVTIYHDTCGRCGITITYVVWDDHDYMQTVIGTELYNVCQNCADRVLIGDYVLGDGNEEDSDCVHTFTTFVIDPTCEGRGSTWYECSKCGFAFETDFVDKIPHQYQVVGRKEPTCTVSGYLISECETCGKAAPSDDTFLPPLGHSWKTVSSILGDDDMITTKSECERCHVTKTETFPTAAGQAQNWLLTVIRGLFSGFIDMYETVANGIEVGGVTAGEVITGSLIISCFLLLLLLILKVLR